MELLRFIIATFFLETVLGYYTLKQLSHTHLATSINKGSPVYGGLNLGTATDAAYDPVNKIVYVIGKESAVSGYKFVMFNNCIITRGVRAKKG